MKKVIFVSVLATLMFAGCSKNKNMLKDTTWVVESMKMSESSDYLYSNDYCIYGELFLKFYGTEIFSLQSFPCCIGGKLNVGNSKIDFKDKSSSLARDYCDPFTEDCADLLINKITHYETDGQILVLRGKNGAEMNCVNYIKQ